MLLHELELLGFKSFGERTRLRFDPSFTAIVGPNGSGKSNVVDAIRWLLGEQSHKQLRTPDSSEVLYQGEQAEDRMNFAQVEMTLIPSPGETFGEGNGESLAIGRRYERDGSNHYLINGHKARLKDVRQTLAEYGFGLNAMSILSQGRIDAVLSLMPEERRVILEEVAQVHGFQVNKEKTLDKIAATRDNLQRLEDVLKEVTERMAELAQQALAARRHQELLEAKADRERWLTARDLDRRHAAADTLRGELRDAEAAVESYREQVAQVREELAEVEALAQGLATELTAHLAQQSELAVQAAEARSANQRISDQEARLREAAGTAARRQESLSARAKDLAAAMAQLEFDLAEARRHAEEATKRYQETQAERQSLVGELARVESAFEASRQSREDLLARQRRVERELAGVEERLSQLAHGQSELKGQQERLATQAAELEEEVRTRGAATEEAAREAERRNGSLLSLTEEVAEVRADVLQFQEAWQEAAHLRAAREAELRTLEELEQNLEGYQAGVRALLQETELGASGALALLMEQVQIDPRYAVAVEAALGNLTQLVVAEDWDAARAALRELADRHLGRAALAVLEAVPAVEPQRLIQTPPTLEPDESRQDISARGDHWGDRGEWGQVHGPRETKIHAPLHPALRTGPLPLTAAMEAPASLQPLLEALCGDMLVVNSLEDAIALQRAGRGGPVVTTDGAVLHPWGGVTGGSDDPLAAGPVVRRGRREELAAAITGLAASVETARLRHMETRERLERLESARSEAQSKAHEAQSHLAAAKRTLQESERRLAELRTSMEQLAKRAESQAGQVAQAETQRLTLQESLAGIAEGLSGIGSTAQLEEEVRRLREDTARTKEAEHAAQLRARELEGRVQELERSLTRSTEEAARVASELEVIAGEAAELHAKLKQVVADLPAFREAEATAAAALEASRTEESRLRRELGEAQHAVSSARSDLVGLEGDLAQALGERESLQIRLARAEADVELLGKQFREDPWFAEQFPGMAEDFAALLSHADWKAFVTPLASSAQLKRELSEIDAELAALGQVNTLADRDYSHYEERQRNLRSQREDLMAAVSDLEQSLKEIEQKSKLALEEVYALTRANFQRVFSELFPGGEARLEWTDPDNILESGLDIHVHFPGKGERHLMQFSGGERTLIAIAFLFAVLQAKPPTFVILDEVEAALDDVNVEKFLHLVDLYKDTFQFVVITHNKLTMEHAPELYGVTMKRGGTSQVVSVRVQDWIAAYGEGTEQGAGPAKALAGVG